MYCTISLLFVSLVRFPATLPPPVHDHDAIRDRKNVRQRMADEDGRHL
jgi:hypothetical protein